MTDPTRGVSQVPDGARETCEDCGRKGTRGFTTIPAGTAQTSVGPVDYPARTACTGRVACRRRSYRSIPAEARAQRRLALELMNA